MKLLFVIGLILFQSVGYGQGKILEYGESASLIGYGIGTIDGSNDYLHSIFYGYSFERKVDVDMRMGWIDDVKLIGGSITGYLDSSPLQCSTSLLFSRRVEDNADWNKGINFTAFHSRSTSNDTFTPSAGFTFAGTEEYFINFGIDLLINKSKSGLLLGMEYNLAPEGDNSLGVIVGVLFHNGDKTKLNVK